MVHSYSFVVNGYVLQAFLPSFLCVLCLFSAVNMLLRWSTMLSIFTGVWSLVFMSRTVTSSLLELIVAEHDDLLGT